MAQPVTDELDSRRLIVIEKGQSVRVPWDAKSFRKYDLDSADVSWIRQGIIVSRGGRTFSFAKD